MLEQYGLWIAMACGLLAVGYGAISVQWILARSAGNERMQTSAAAIQEGAGAYLGRQFQTIAVVGVLLFLVIGLGL